MRETHHLHKSNSPSSLDCLVSLSPWAMYPACLACWSMVPVHGTQPPGTSWLHSASAESAACSRVLVLAPGGSLVFGGYPGSTPGSGVPRSFESPSAGWVGVSAGTREAPSASGFCFCALCYVLNSKLCAYGLRLALACGGGEPGCGNLRGCPIPTPTRNLAVRICAGAG